MIQRDVENSNRNSSALESDRDGADGAGACPVFQNVQFNQFSTEVAADEVFWMQADSRIVYANRSACDRLGYTRDEMLNMYVWDWDPLFSKEKWGPFWKEFVEKKSMVLETKHRSKSGEIFPVEVKGYYYESNGEGYLFAFVTDISKRQQQEQQIKQYQESLEKLVAERTAQLQKSMVQMEKAKNEALQSAQAKSQFLANMSHEIRTPMNGIVGMLQLLMKSDLSQKQKQYIDAIHSSSDSLMTIINDILDLSKIEAGKMTIESTPFDLPALFLTIDSLMRVQAQKKGIEFRYKCDCQMAPKRFGDVVRIRQVLENLIGNAIKFTEKGDVVVIAQEHDVKANWVRFEVRDSGPGIKQETLCKLFERFTQEDESTTRKYGGTGLGLSICQQLVTLMGGEIGAESELNQGSIFWFEIPLAPLSRVDSVEPHRFIVTQEEDWQPLPTRFEHARALLVEDNLINQQVATFTLEDMGIDVVLAENGEQALEKLAVEQFDVVLMDCHMPVLDGYEATRRLRKMDSCANLPVIALTANAIKGEREKCLAAGMNDYVSKPFDENELLNKLARYLSPPMG